jgi:glycosyltransferase involved in cell wall biosynthesis
MERLPKVAILLALFEPSEYLITQIKSLESQVGVELYFYIGDDGSSQKKLRQYKDYFPKKHQFYQFNRVGHGQNFMMLLAASGDEDYFAFADQDDIWLENKLMKHIEVLKNHENSIAGSHSNSALLVNGNVFEKKSRCFEHKISQLITENCVQGCTLVINKKARDAIVSATPDYVRWHDWWIGLVLVSIGKLFLIPGVDTQYRIHDNNAIGQPSFLNRLKNSFIKNPGILLKQGKDLRDCFGLIMQEADYSELITWINRWDKNFFGRVFTGLIDLKRRRTYFSDFGRRFFSALIKP